MRLRSRKKEQIRDLTDQIEVLESKLFLTDAWLGFYTEAVGLLWGELTVGQACRLQERNPDLVDLAVEAAGIVTYEGSGDGD